MRPFLALLTQEEHTALIKLGAMQGFAQNGIPPSRSAEFMQKMAEGGTWLNDTLYTALLAAGAIGVPIGVAWHAVGRMANEDDRKEREQRARIQYYTDVGKNLQGGLAPVKAPAA